MSQRYQPTLYQADINLYFIVMISLPSDKIFSHLRQRGLILSGITKLQIPKPLQPPKSFMNILGSYLSKKQIQSNDTSVKIYPILNSSFLLAQKNMLYLYRYKMDPETSQIIIDQPQSIQLTYNVWEIVSCDPKFVQDRGQVPVIIVSETGLGLFIYDSKEMLLRQKNFVRIQSILGIGFISEKQLLVLDNNRVLVQFVIAIGVLKKRQSVKKIKQLDPKPIQLQKQKIVRSWIVGQADEQQDAIMILFYAVQEINKSEDDKTFKLRVKQYKRTLDGDVEHLNEPSFQIASNNLVVHEKLKLLAVGDYFCIQMPKEVLILRKKFNKYMFLDNMMQKIAGCSINLNSMGLIASVGEKLMEVNCIQFGDPKCTSRICDQIEFQSPQLIENYKNFHQVWPIIIKKEYSLVFLFVKADEIIMSHLIKREPMQKLLNLVNKNKTKLVVIQDIGHNLGVSRKDFYLKLWNVSPKENSDIYKYLIPCEDIPSIKRQLKSTLRRRTIPVSQMLKILQKMHEIIERSLKEDLNQVHLKELVKNDFLRRKVKMNSMDKLLDHRIFEKIYQDSLLSVFRDIVQQELFPIKKKTDPMYAMADQSPDPELKSLQNVFQEFKVLLLQDYKDFLIQFLALYPGNILKIISRYNFLLPNFPFKVQVQRPSKINEPILKSTTMDNVSQPLWFQVVTVSQWQSQLTKERIMKQLHYEYQTSKLNETIDEFVQSRYGLKKRFKHGLISVSLQQYIQKVNSLSGVNLFLDLCQYANEESIETKGDPNISKKLLDFFQKHNKLTGPELEECKLYASMHYFMLHKGIGQKKNLKITALKNLSQQNLIALFFLENKQQKQFIFQEFMKLYEDKNKFRNVIQKFVNSENCSRIQLQILITEINRKGPEFQRDNQELIQLLIMGLCTKLEIRQSLVILENDESQEFHTHCLIDNIEVSRVLALKINRIKQLRKCRQILTNFKCQKMTYQQLIILERDNQIFKMLLEKYFNEDMISTEVDIEGEKITLNSPRNMLTLLIYLQQTVYYSVRTFDLLINYGLTLILWKEFDCMSQIIYEENILQTLQIDQSQFLQNLIQRALESIYFDDEIVYDEETKNQIISILNIERNQSYIKVRETAKLKLASIFEGFDCVVHPSDIETICHQWKNLNRQSFMADLIDRYNEKLNFQLLKTIYEFLEISSLETQNVEIINSQFVVYCVIYAEKLMEKERFKEVIQILKFLKNIDGVKIQFSLISQAFLKSLFFIHPENVEDGRRMIDFFIQNNTPELDFNIKNLFEKHFDDQVLSLWTREDQIAMSSLYFYRNSKGKCNINYDDLWNLILDESHTVQQKYYNYYFIAAGMRNPQIGFINLQGISYNLEQITNIFLNRLEFFMSQNKQLWIIDYDSLLKKFMEGLLKIAKSRLDMVIESKAGTNKLDIILELLKQKKQQNADLIKSMTRVKQQSKSKMKKEQRKNRFINFIEELRKLEDQKVQVIEEEPIEQIPVIPEVFMTWKKVDEEKKIISTSMPAFMSDRDIIEQIYDNGDAFEVPKEKSKPIKSIFTNLFLPSVNSPENVGLIQKMIEEKEFEKVLNYQPDYIWAALKNIHQKNPEATLIDNLDILDHLRIGDVNKRQVARLSSIFKKNLSEGILKDLFSYEFIAGPLECSDDEKYHVIYEQLRPKIQQIVGQKTAPQIKDLAHMLGNSLESSQFSAMVYYQALIHIGKKFEFISDAALLSQEFFGGLAQYPNFICENYTTLLDSFKDKEMRNYVRGNLARIMEEKEYHEYVSPIKTY